jgi:hypothetical protein
MSADVQVFGCRHDDAIHALRRPASEYFLLKNVWPKRREAYVSKPRHYRQDKNEKPCYGKPGRLKSALT